MQGVRFRGVLVRRPSLRIPFPAGFADRLKGRTVRALTRRGKFLLAALSSGETLILHLGMSGFFVIEPITGWDMAGNELFSWSDVGGDHDVDKLGDNYFILTSDGLDHCVDEYDPKKTHVWSWWGPSRSRRNSMPPAWPAPVVGSASPLKVALMDQQVVAGLRKHLRQ